MGPGRRNHCWHTEHGHHLARPACMMMQTPSMCSYLCTPHSCISTVAVQVPVLACHHLPWYVSCCGIRVGKGPCVFLTAGLHFSLCCHIIAYGKLCTMPHMLHTPHCVQCYSTYCVLGAATWHGLAEASRGHPQQRDCADQELLPGQSHSTEQTEGLSMGHEHPIAAASCTDCYPSMLAWLEGSKCRCATLEDMVSGQLGSCTLRCAAHPWQGLATWLLPAHAVRNTGSFVHHNCRSSPLEQRDASLVGWMLVWFCVCGMPGGAAWTCRA